MEGGTGAEHALTGHEPELALLTAFVAGRRAGRGLVVRGVPGIGKTTLWEAGLAGARSAGVRALVARASEAELQLSFVALGDLLAGVDLDGLRSLPSPQRRALDAALLRDGADDPVPSPLAVAAGLTTVLRTLADERPVLVAIDDAPWLDAASAGALQYAARRLGDVPVRFLLTRRTGDATGLEQAIQPDLLELELGGLSFGATRLLLHRRLGLSLPRQLMRRLFETAQGNPLFALEIGRVVAERRASSVGDELPVPAAVDELFGTRIAALPPPQRRLLLAVALSGEPERSVLERLEGPEELERALEDGLVIAERGRVRASHPLLAAAARARSRAAERRALHGELAQAADDPERRARHLALAARQPDAEVATEVARAARRAAERGGYQEAAELGEHALRLTPPDAPSRTDRLLDVAEYLGIATSGERVAELLLPVIDRLEPRAARVRAWLLLAGGTVTSNEELRRYHEHALAEAGDDPALRALPLAEAAGNSASIAVERIREAEAWAAEALAALPPGRPDEERLVLYALAWARSLAGSPIDDLCDRFLRSSPAAFSVSASPERIAGQRLVWRGEPGAARPIFTRLLQLADEQVEPHSYALVRLHLCELELRTGNWQGAEDLLDDWAASLDVESMVWPMYERCRALLAAGRGLPEEAAAWAARAIARANETGNTWDLLEARRAAGTAALLLHEPDRAAEELGWVWGHTGREGVRDPGAFPAAPDLVEALTELGRVDEARSVTDRLEEQAREQRHPWGLAGGRRCRALVELGADGDRAATESRLAEASAAYADLGLRFDAARSLLLLGRAQRRRRSWGAARRSLEAALAAFTEIGSPGWAADASADLARVPGRRARSEALTPAERQISELAASGLSNKEIARRLVVSVHTVEKHLSHAYAKLGVRSRTQLADRLAVET